MSGSGYLIVQISSKAFRNNSSGSCFFFYASSLEVGGPLKYIKAKRGRRPKNLKTTALEALFYLFVCNSFHFLLKKKSITQKGKTKFYVKFDQEKSPFYGKNVFSLVSHSRRTPKQNLSSF